MKNKKIAKITNGPAFDSVLLAMIQIVTYATGILTTKILASELSLTEFGSYATVNSVINIAASLTLFGLGDSVNYYYNRAASEEEHQQKEAYINTIFFIQLCIGMLVGVALAVCSGAISNYYNNPLVKPLILIICFKPWISNATHLYQVLFTSNGKAKLIAFRNLFLSVSKIVLIYIAVKKFDSLTMIFVCLVLLDAVQLIAFRYIFGKIRFKVAPFSFSGEKLLPVIKYTVPMGVYFVTTTLMREIDKLVVGRLGTTEMLAVYSNCARTLPLNFLATAFSTVLIPYIMKNISAGNYQQTAQIMKKYLSVGYLSVWMFSGALLLCAPEAICFFYSEEYLPGLPVFIIYLLDGMVQFASVHLVIAGSGNSKFIMKVSLGLLAMNAVLSVVMYKVLECWGNALLGPAMATLLISVLYMSILIGKSVKILQLKVGAILPIKQMVRYLCELLIIGVVLFQLKQALQMYQMNQTLLFILLCICYCAAAAVLHQKDYRTLFMEINQLKLSKR